MWFRRLPRQWWPFRICLKLLEVFDEFPWHFVTPADIFSFATGQFPAVFVMTKRFSMSVTRWTRDTHWQHLLCRLGWFKSLLSSRGMKFCFSLEILMQKKMLRLIYNHQISSELYCFSALMSLLKYSACVSLTALEGLLQGYAGSYYSLYSSQKATES